MVGDNHSTSHLQSEVASKAPPSKGNSQSEHKAQESPSAVYGVLLHMKDHGEEVEVP